VAEFVFAVREEEIQGGQILTLTIDDVPVAFTRVDGHIVAFGDVCTHDDGSLAEGTIEGDCVVCPRHGARFNLFTGKATFPAPSPIPIYETKIEDGNVQVKLDDAEK
jgi:3-phenylpropionate/trans-cinnamate dioxygenase ferredoxin subunit